GSMGSMPGGQVLFLPRDSSGDAIPRKRPEIHSRPDLVHATERALVPSGPILFYRRDKSSVGVAMNDLIDRLRVSAEPVGKLLLEAADALQNALARIVDLPETLREVVEDGHRQCLVEF